MDKFLTQVLELVKDDLTNKKFVSPPQKVLLAIARNGGLILSVLKNVRELRQ